MGCKAFSTATQKTTTEEAIEEMELQGVIEPSAGA